MRALVQWLCRVVVRTFFRRIETVGVESVPVDGPIIFAINHPNGLVDPLVVLALAPRRISFLAKAPLFRTPVVRHFVTALECLPVYRRQDAADPSQNRATIEAARDLLARGGAIALFPEGLTHDEPAMQPLKTGAARIALGAQALIAEARPDIAPVKLVPVGLYYPARGIFRSEAVMVFGETIDVATVVLDEASEPPRDDVRALTAKLETSMRSLTINARDSRLIALAASAARVLEDAAGAEDRSVPAALHRRLRLMQRILERHAAIERTSPELSALLIERLQRHDALARAHGLDPEVPAEIGLAPAIAHLLRSLVGLVLLSPLVLMGMVENYLPYRITGRVALHLARDEEQVLSTLKVLAGLILFPATWLVVSGVVASAGHGSWGVLHAVLAPIAAWAALWFRDRARFTLLGARVLWLAVFRPHIHRRLIAERRALAEQLLDTNDPLAAAAAPDEGSRSPMEHETISPPGP